MKPANLLVLMSGGTSTTAHATLVGLLRAARRVKNMKVLAGRPGLFGALEEDLVDLTGLDDPTLDRLAIVPRSGFIGTSRIGPLNGDQISRLHDVADAHQIRYLVNIGGNGTLRQSQGLAAATPASQLAIGMIPNTVDNDLGDPDFRQVYYTAGFPSCITYWMHKTHLLDQENRGACTHDRVLVAQTFGRKTGFLAGATRAADPERKMPLLILLPEDQQDSEQVMGAIDEKVRRSGRAIVILSEGYEMGDIRAAKDRAGQTMYSSSGQSAAQLLVNACLASKIQARAFVPGVDQRLEIVLGSSRDLENATELGQFTFSTIMDRPEHFLASFAGPSIDDPRPTAMALSDIRDFSRIMPRRWVSEGRFDVTDEYVKYLNTLVREGRPHLHTSAGIPAFELPELPIMTKKLAPWSSRA